VEKAGASLQAASRGSTSSDDSSVTSPVSTSDVSPVTTSVTTSSVSAAVTSPVSTSDVSPVTTSVTTSSVSAAVTNTSDVTRSLRNEVRKLSSTMLADVDVSHPAALCYCCLLFVFVAVCCLFLLLFVFVCLLFLLLFTYECMLLFVRHARDLHQCFLFTNLSLS